MPGDYAILTLDLTAARSRERVVSPGVRLFGLTVLSLPAGADARIRFKHGLGDDLSLREGDVLEPDDEGAVFEEEGVFLTHTAQPGLTLSLYLAYSATAVRRT